MKTKAHFYVRRASCGDIIAEPKDGYIERFGKRIFSYDKRGNYWYITDNKTGMFINCFPTLKQCQDYLQKNVLDIERILNKAEEEPDDVKFTRAVIETMRKELYL